MIHQMEFVIPGIMARGKGAVGARCRPHLIIRPGQADHVVVHVGSILVSAGLVEGERLGVALPDRASEVGSRYRCAGQF